MTAVLRRIAAVCLLGVVAASGDAARGQPVTFRLGYGGAAEEPMWLLVSKPDLAKNYGKAYILDATRFTSSDNVECMNVSCGASPPLRPEQADR